MMPHTRRLSPRDIASLTVSASIEQRRDQDMENLRRRIAAEAKIRSSPNRKARRAKRKNQRRFRK